MRIATAVLAAGMAGGMLTGCGSGSKETTAPAPTTPPPASAPSSTRSQNPATLTKTPPNASAPSSPGSRASAGRTTPHASGPVPVPQPSHVVIVVEENHSFRTIIGNPDAPYMNSLATQGALLTDSTAVTHPSEPNYLALFSGSAQGVTDDSCPHSFPGDNLGAQLAAAGKSFGGYSEGLPSTGYLGCTAGNYARRHSPWTNFTTVPASASLPFSAFPQDYNALPTVSIVIPNLVNDMHDGTVPAADTWLHENLDGYAQWAKTHNSLLVLTWDEADNSTGNQVTTILTGASVTPGRYSEPVNHYRVLRTIESAFGLPPLGHAADTQPIADIWH